jgi:hypothetical protein
MEKPNHYGLEAINALIAAVIMSLCLTDNIGVLVGGIWDYIGYGVLFFFIFFAIGYIFSRPKGLILVWVIVIAHFLVFGLPEELAKWF